MRELLLVIDLQNGFVTTKTEHILPGIKRLVDSFVAQQRPVAFTRFINRPEGAHVKWMGWSRFMAEPENSLVNGLCPPSATIFDKYTYTAFTDEFKTFLQERTINQLLLCGIATDGCVLKTAVDAFEQNIRPVVVQDACASHAGQDLHAAGLLLISRFIGKRQITTVQDIIAAGGQQP